MKSIVKSILLTVLVCFSVVTIIINTMILSFLGIGSYSDLKRLAVISTLYEEVDEVPNKSDEKPNDTEPEPKEDIEVSTQEPTDYTRKVLFDYEHIKITYIGYVYDLCGCVA